MGEELSPHLIVSERTPKAFIWHTANDTTVPVGNSLDYAKSLQSYNIPVELHIFPNGRHGLALAEDSPHVAQWASLLINWLKDIAN